MCIEEYKMFDNGVFVDLKKYFLYYYFLEKYYYFLNFNF